jgi:hypothetical protein
MTEGSKLNPGSGFPGARSELLALADRLVAMEQWLTKRPQAADAEAQIVIATEAVMAAWRALRTLHDEKKGGRK